MTTARNYESMLRDGCIKTSPDAFIGKGVFTTELTNFFKRWRVDKSWQNESLQESLLQQVSKGFDDIVILKIPTKSLDSEKLVVRSQNKLCGMISRREFAPLDKDIDVKFPLRKDVKGWLSSLRSYLKRNMETFEKPEIVEHLTSGANAGRAKHFTRKKEAIEYIYLDNIPIKDVEKIGQVNVAELRRTSDYDPIRPMRSIFGALLRGTPEQKGALLLNC